MLEPSSRRLLLDSLHPPDGHRLDWAVGTTYSLDLVALLTAPVAFAFSEWQDREGRPVADPLALLKAVRQYAGQVCLFCQAGKIHIPKTYQPLLASVEDSVVEALAPKGGSFHPKLWFLRFVNDDGEVLYRVLCLSRNLTFDRSWDTVLCLEGALLDRVNAISRNHPLGEFVETLPDMAVRPLSSVWQKRLQTLAYELRRVNFEIPAPFEDLEFVPIGHTPRASWPFPDRSERLLVVSPFVDDGTLRSLAESSPHVEVVSRPEALDQLTAETLPAFKAIWTLDDSADPEPADDAGDAEAKPEAESPEAVQSVVDAPLAGLHAKLYVADAGWNAHVWTGSANATRAAFERNVEFLVRLQGKKSKCGVGVILGEAVPEHTRHVSSMRDLLQPYRRRSDVGEIDLEKEAFGRQVTDLVVSLAKSRPVALCRVTDDPEVFLVDITPSKRLTTPPHQNLTLTCRLASIPTSPQFSVDLSASPWVQLANVSLLGLSSFFVFTATTADGRFSQSFLLNIPLVDPPAERQERLLRHLLSDRDRVLKFLLLLLMDPNSPGWMTALVEGFGTESTGPVNNGLFDVTLLETLLRALDREPSRIDQVAALIADLRQTEDGRQLLPPCLDAIWEPIWSVRQEQLAQVAAKPSGKTPTSPRSEESTDA